ncbi:unnamed protein product [Polarella glacialis]|uniref:Domain of unknown function at the cortex 1 domain-containing protein n=1 Tax=Polarella glacialis TaxID=89957 RepID=A0A813EJY7_POLGL|nr:unnamed protein product [Polarella glacialis]
MESEPLTRSLSSYLPSLLGESESPLSSYLPSFLGGSEDPPVPEQDLLGESALPKEAVLPSGTLTGRLLAQNSAKPMELNALKGIPIETDDFSGALLFIHRPSPEPDNWPYRQGFSGKERCWEFRLQGKFKTDPGQVYFGAELTQSVGLSWTAMITVNWMLAIATTLASARGVHFDYALEMTELDNGEIVRPHYSFPLIAADVVLRTPDGQSPPPLTGHFEKMSLEEIHRFLSLGALQFTSGLAWVLRDFYWSAMCAIVSLSPSVTRSSC